MPKPKNPRGSPRKPEKENTEYYKGEIRKLKKRVKILERENSRLSKYLRNAIDWIPDESEQELIPSLREPRWMCQVCGHTKSSELILPHANGKKVIKHLKCLQCGEREKVVLESEEEDG